MEAARGASETSAPLSRKVLKKKSAGTAGAEIALVNFASDRAINVHHTASVSVHRLPSSSFSRLLLSLSLSLLPQPSAPRPSSPAAAPVNVSVPRNFARPPRLPLFVKRLQKATLIMTD